jgi:predicted SAM-dependent methyltransferase
MDYNTTFDLPPSRQLADLFTRLLTNQQPIKIIVGARDTQQAGWIATDIHSLNLLDRRDWQKNFAPGTISAIMAEHVWEHLTHEEGIRAAEICYEYLQGGGYLRLAVPDGLHPNPAYLDWVRPQGVGPDAEEHKLIYDYRSLGELLRTCGFHVQLLEYFDELGRFHYQEWNPEQGLIRRSRRFDPRNHPYNHSYNQIYSQPSNQSPTAYNSTVTQWRKHLSLQSCPLNSYCSLMNINYTSLILDAWKLS